MADNVNITPGVGATVAADQVNDGVLGSGVYVQYVKLMDGTIDGTTKATVNATGLKVDASGAAIPATQSGTWTVQPGNTANTTAWKTDDSAAWDKGSGTGGSLTQRIIVDNSQLAALGQATMANSAPVVVASDQSTIKTGGNTITQASSSTITRPANATPYASGQLLANSVTAGSVNALQFSTLARVSGGSGVITGAVIQKSTNTITNAAFRIHYFNTIPTFVTAGDGSAISTVVQASGKGYLGYVDIITMTGFSDVAWGTGAPDNTRGCIPYVATAQIIYAIVEVRGAYTPGNAEIFTIYTV